MAESQLPSPVDAEFLPSVTASCQGGLMTIKVETKQSFQGKRTIHRYVYSPWYCSVPICIGQLF